MVAAETEATTSPKTERRLAMTRSEELVSAGDWFGAIDVLTEANKELRHHTLEKRLVELRHTAFASMKQTGAPTDWPPTYEDLWPDLSGIPEIGRSELTATTLGSGILNHGALIVRGLFDDQKVRRLVKATDRSMDAFDQHLAGAAPQDTVPWFSRFKPDPPHTIGKARDFVRRAGGVYTVDSPRFTFEVLEMFREVGIRTAIEEYFGERSALSVKKWTIRKVPVLGGADWHQDGAFIDAGARSVNLWLSLSHCGVDAPGLDIVPFRLNEIVETGTNGAYFDWSVGQGTVDQILPNGDWAHPVFAPGDAILFDEMNLHRTRLQPEMTKIRYALESWFFAPTNYPQNQIPFAF